MARRLRRDLGLLGIRPPQRQRLDPPLRARGPAHSAHPAPRHVVRPHQRPPLARAPHHPDGRALLHRRPQQAPGRRDRSLPTRCRRADRDGMELALAGAIHPSPEGRARFHELQSLAEGLNCSFYPNIGRADLAALYGRSAVLIHAAGFGVDADEFPERLEHFGITPIEAASFGCIPVVYGQGGPREVVRTLGCETAFDTVDECAADRVAAPRRPRRLVPAERAPPGELPCLFGAGLRRRGRRITARSGRSVGRIPLAAGRCGDRRRDRSRTRLHPGHGVGHSRRLPPSGPRRGTALPSDGDAPRRVCGAPSPRSPDDTAADRPGRPRGRPGPPHRDEKARRSSIGRGPDGARRRDLPRPGGARQLERVDDRRDQGAAVESGPQVERVARRLDPLRGVPRRRPSLQPLHQRAVRGQLRRERRHPPAGVDRQPDHRALGPRGGDELPHQLGVLRLGGGRLLLRPALDDLAPGRFPRGAAVRILPVCGGRGHRARPHDVRLPHPFHLHRVGRDLRPAALFATGPGRAPGPPDHGAVLHRE